MLNDDSGRGFDLILVLFLLGLLLFASPLLDWFLSHGLWYIPYLLWLLLIALGAWLQLLRSRRDF